MGVPFDLKCPSCGAPLPAPIDGKSVCSFCARELLIGPQAPDVDLPRVPSAQGAERPTAPKSQSGRGCVTALLGILVAGVGVAGYVTYKDQVQKAQHAGLSMGADVAKPNQSVLWDDVGGPPLPIIIDGKEFVLGRVRTLDRNDQLQFVVTDSATLATRWSAGPYGSYSDGYVSTFVVVAGERVIISDFHSKLHFLDLRSGQELATLDLSDRVSCMTLEKDRVRVIQVDDKTLLLDPVTRATTQVPREQHQDAYSIRQCARKSVERKAIDKERAPTVEGFETYRVLIDGSEAIAAGKKAPGTPTPQVVGFDPKSRRLLWRQVLPNVDPNTVDASSALAGDLGGHRYVGVYPVGSETHRLTAFDARNGARLWDVKLRGIFSVDRIDDIVVTEQYVYAVRSDSVDVLEAKTGRLIGAIGHETYDEGE